jgi:hypothetical protein
VCISHAITKLVKRVDDDARDERLEQEVPPGGAR